MFSILTYYIYIQTITNKHMLTEKNLLQALNNKNIKYKIHKHQALFSVKDSVLKRGAIEGAHSKNIFLKNKKDQFFLLSCLEHWKIDLKIISKALGLGNISFANEAYLGDILGVLPGSVTPFGLLNDTENKVSFYFDSNFLKFSKINFHPLVNTATLTITTDDFKNFLVENNKKINIYDFNKNSLMV